MRSLFKSLKSGFRVLVLISALSLAACSGSGEDKTPTGGNATQPAAENAAKPAETEDSTVADNSAPLIATNSTAENDEGLPPGKLDFAKFSIEVKASPEAENYKLVTLSHSGKTVTADDGVYRIVTPGAAAGDFPLPGCETITLELFTGGANCCFGYYILSACPDEDVAAFHEPTDGGMGAATTVAGTAKGYPITDPAFMYYSPEGQSSAAPLSLTRVQSPRLTRYVIFADNAWRGDKIGEFAEAYKEMAAAAAGEGGVDPVARAISLAYYTHMAGAAEAEVKALLEAELPAEFAGLKDTIFSDIVNAAAEFKPFTPVPLQ